MQTRALSLPLGSARSLHTFTHQFTGAAPILILKLFLYSPTIKKARGADSGRRWTKSSLLQSRLPPPRPAGPRLGTGRKVTASPASQLHSPPPGSPSAEGQAAPLAPSGGVGPRAPEGAPRALTAPAPRPGSLRTHSPTAPRGTHAPAPPAPAARWPGAKGRGGGTARAQKSLSSPIGGTAWAPGLTQPARPHSTAPSGEKERPEREGDGRAAGRRGAAAGPGSSRRTRRKFQD